MTKTSLAHIHNYIVIVLTMYYILLSKYFLTCRLNDVTVLHAFMLKGREFHKFGATTVNDLLYNTVLNLGTNKFPFEIDLSCLSLLYVSSLNIEVIYTGARLCNALYVSKRI